MSYNLCPEITLKRARNIGQKTLIRTLERKLDWPSKDFGQKPPKDQAPGYTSLDEAFSSIAQCMSQITRQCKRYYKSHPPADPRSQEACHCKRFHTPAYSTLKSRNPLQRSEDINIVVNPGSYAISACKWGTAQQQTNVVHMQDGDTVELDFVL